MKSHFKSLHLNEHGLRKCDQITAVFDEALEKLFDLLPNDDPRLRVRVVDKLQEACFLAKRTVAIAPVYQVDPDAG